MLIGSAPGQLPNELDHKPDGRVLKREFKAGDVMWSDAQTHIGENIGDTPTNVIIVEFKSQAAACARQ